MANDRVFKLEIRLGNAAMTDSTHVAGALERVAREVSEKQSQRGRIRDVNGNTVGEYSLDGGDYEADDE